MTAVKSAVQIPIKNLPLSGLKAGRGRFSSGSPDVTEKSRYSVGGGDGGSDPSAVIKVIAPIAQLGIH